MTDIKKISIIAFSVVAVAAGFTVLSKVQVKDNSVTYAMYKESNQTSVLDKSQAQTAQLQNVIQKQINSLDSVSSSSVEINGRVGDSKTTVSTVVKLSSGKDLTQGQQDSIKNLIKNSVNNLSDGNIYLYVSNADT